MTFGALPYVPITRYFRDVNEDAGDGRTWQILRHFRSAKTTTWKDLLGRDAKGPAAHAVVVVAQEVYVRQRGFLDVARCLAKEVDFGIRDVQIVVTVRTGTWKPND